MRIGIVAFSDFERFPLGGGLTFLREFIQASTELSNPDIVLIGWGGASKTRNAERQVRIGSKAYPFISIGEGTPPSMIPDRTVFHASSAGWKSAMSQVGLVDVFYCHSPESVLGAARAGRAVPIALHLHGSRDAIGRSRFRLGRVPPVKWLYRQLFLRPALARADAVLATVSEEEHDALTRSALVRSEVPCVRIPGMVRETLRSPQDRPASDSIQLVCVGRLEPVKGIELPILAVAALTRRGVDCRLAILGEGSDRRRLTRLVRSLGLDQRVEFLGVCDSDEVVRRVRAARIFVSGSRQEGFSLALLEALALGTPAVATQVGSAREVIIPGSTGEIVLERDPEKFADAIQRVARYGADSGRNCHETAMTYSSPRVSRRILDVLESIATRQPCAVRDDANLLSSGAGGRS